jgi:PAS domain S-box-containing protein
MAYSAAFLLVGVCVATGLSGVLPVFLEPTGPSVLRLTVIAASILLIFLSCAIFGWHYFRIKSPIVYWYSLALALFGTALLSSFFTSELGAPMNWISRIAVYLSGIYFIVAVLSRQADYSSTASQRLAQPFANDYEQTAKLFANLMNGFIYGKVVTDDGGKPVDLIFLDVNDAFERISGIKRENALGRRLSSVFPKESKDSLDWTSVLGKVAITGEPTDFEVFRETWGKWLNIKAYSPKQGYFVSIFENVTNRKEAEEALRASEERHRIISNITTDFVFSCVKTPQKEFVIDWMAGATEKVFGYSASEIRNKRCWKFTVQPQDLSIFEEKVTGLKPGQSSVSELRITHKNGSTRWLEVVVRMEQDDSNPKNYRLFGACRDITERKQAEEKLKESEERFFKAFQLNPAPMAISFVDGEFIDVNSSFERLTGFTRDEVIGKRGAGLGMYGLASEREELIRRLQQDDHVYNFPITFNNKSMKQIHALFSLEQIKLQNKPFVLGTAIDVTEKKRLQNELEKYSRSLEELVKQKTEQLRDKERLAAIGTTAGMVGHDIRNPLQAIVGDLYLAKSDLAAMPKSEEKGELQESLAEIEKNVEYIDKIVQDLQDFAKPLKPVAKETDLEEVCNEVLFKSDIEENVEASYDVQNDAKKLVSDPELMKRILSNLVSNAVQAMPEGGKLMIHGFKDADGVVITVEDTGVGIPEEVRPKLFTPLFTTKAKGQGFGLAVIKRMTEALGGSVTFESEVGKGTKFVVRFPQKS